ncbi:MAG TPA: thiolase family protein [Acidimicrobiales bacterium]|nr:thiolase family protein [Acidimicrobiales bacterium]
MLTRDVAVVGVGYSPPVRHGGPDIDTMTRTAALGALADAGLQPADVDAVVEYSFGMRGDSPIAVGAQRLLGIPDLAMFNDIMGTGPSGLAGAMDAAMAIASGAAEVALVYRTITREAGHTGAVQEGPAAARGQAAFTAPYGYAGGIMMAIGMKMRRRMHELGTTQEHYGLVALNARRWARDNERALLRQEITMDDYLASRPIAEPLLLFDCDYPVSGSVAAVLTTRERALDLAKKPVLVEALAYGTGRDPDWVFADDLIFGGTLAAGERLWSRTSLTPADVHVAELYDGFTHIAMSWIEALGFCGVGEFGDWVDGGKTIGPGGSLPLNTHGGQLTEGRLHGLAFLTEAVLQLRGECGARQVPGAAVAVVANAHGPQAGCMLLRTE